MAAGSADFVHDLLASWLVEVQHADARAFGGES